MPGGIEHPVAGYVAFAAIKFAGYSIATFYLNREYSPVRRNPLLVGAARTVIGMAAGAAYFFLVASWLPYGPLLYLAGLIPIRLVEWRLLVRLFYDPQLQQREKCWKVACLGMFWSFVCDLPAIMGVYYIGGVWIC